MPKLPVIGALPALSTCSRVHPSAHGRETTDVAELCSVVEAVTSYEDASVREASTRAVAWWYTLVRPCTRPTSLKDKPAFVLVCG